NGLLLTVLLFLCPGCGKVERHNLLPWFRIKTTKYPNMGGFGGGQTVTEYYVKSGFRWIRLEDWPGGATVVNPQTVFMFGKGQPEVIHEGERVQKPACGTGFYAATVAHRSQSIDCVQVVEGRSIALGNKIRFRRVTASGTVVIDKTLSVESPGREFMGAVVRFYDEGEHPFFLTGHEWPYTFPECAIVDVDGHSVPAPAGTPARDCSEPALWSKVLQRRLH